MLATARQSSQTMSSLTLTLTLTDHVHQMKNAINHVEILRLRVISSLGLAKLLHEMTELLLRYLDDGGEVLA